MSISIDESDVYDALDDSDETESVAFEIKVAEAIVNSELLPAADDDADRDRLSLVGALVAAAYVDDNGRGDVDSISQGTASISFATDSALDYWRRAKQLDPTGRLGQLDKPDGDLSVPSIHGHRHGRRY